MSKINIVNKILSMLAIGFMMAGFTACGDENDDPLNPAEPTTKKIASVDAIYNYSVNEDNLLVASCEAVIIDPDGVERYKVMDDTQFTISVPYTSFPSTTTVSQKFTVKENLPEGKVYQLGNHCLLSGYVVHYEDGSTEGFNYGASIISSISIPTEKLAAYFERVNTRSYSYTISLNADRTEVIIAQ